MPGTIAPLGGVRFAIFASVLLLLVAAPAAADDDHGHDHAGAVVWDGHATEDCSIADPGTIVWELTEADDAGYVELHIDEPEATVSAVDGPPHVWVSELYPLGEIEADADNIHGGLGAGTRLLATYCPSDTLPHTGAPVVLASLLGLGLLGAGLVLRRTSRA